MQLNHANLSTTDVAGLAGFFTRFFGFSLTAMRGRESFAQLEGTDGFTLTLMKPGKTGPSAYPDSFHIGFFVAGPDDVRAKHAELTDAGLAPDEVQEMTRGGTFTTTFYHRAPGGVLVEVAAHR